MTVLDRSVGCPCGAVWRADPAPHILDLSGRPVGTADSLPRSYHAAGCPYGACYNDVFF